jgi:uncharacterized membrane protein YbhN (UPF0104 family)
MITAGNAAKRALALIIIFGVTFFFYKSFQGNWTSIRSHALKLDYLYLIVSFVSILITYLLSTFGWHLALNTLSSVSKITYHQSVATVNASSLTKYVPGKVWSYALQMYWLVKAGFSKSLIVYVNLINLSISIITSLIVGLGYLLFSPGIFPFMVIFSLLLILVLFDVFFIIFNSSVTNGMISLFNRMFHRDIKYFDISHRLLIDLHLVHFLAAFCFGIGAYLLCNGIGFVVAPGKILLVMSSLLISDVIGFLAVIVPGGLGVREGVMYLMLNNVSTGALSLILPIASRIVNMVVDVVLGTTAFALLRKFDSADKIEENARTAK